MAHNKKIESKEADFINIESYVSNKKRETPFTYKSICRFVSITIFAVVLALLIVCLIKYFI